MIELRDGDVLSRRDSHVVLVNARRFRWEKLLDHFGDIDVLEFRDYRGDVPFDMVQNARVIKFVQCDVDVFMLAIALFQRRAPLQLVFDSCTTVDYAPLVFLAHSLVALTIRNAPDAKLDILFDNLWAMVNLTELTLQGCATPTEAQVAVSCITKTSVAQRCSHTNDCEVVGSLQ